MARHIRLHLGFTQASVATTPCSAEDSPHQLHSMVYSKYGTVPQVQVLYGCSNRLYQHDYSLRPILNACSIVLTHQRPASLLDDNTVIIIKSDLAEFVCHACVRCNTQSLRSTPSTNSSVFERGICNSTRNSAHRFLPHVQTIRTSSHITLSTCLSSRVQLKRMRTRARVINGPQNDSIPASAATAPIPSAAVQR